jgi:DNA-binding winged helix-turn-helix (wHTH) protein
MNDLSNNLISFAEFELDKVQRRLFRRGESVVLSSKAFDLLSFLVANNGRIISKEEILDAV